MQTQRHAFGSPLRYPGGKVTLANFMKLVLLRNHLLDGHYAEIYAGGAGIAWQLLYEEYIQQVHINDLNKSVYAFWHSVLENTEELCRLIQDVPTTIEEWGRQKAIQTNPGDSSLLELGFSTFFLNRTNRSGIIGAGVIGGKAQGGKWRLDARFNKANLIARIKRIARYRQRIHIYNLDAILFIRNILPTLPPQTFCYFDPPYYTKGHGLYEDHYKHEDHVEVAKIISTEVRHPWVVSYDAVPEITDLYSQYRSIKYNIRYTAQERYAGTEIMFFSNDLTIPESLNPARIKEVSSTGLLF